MNKLFLLLTLFFLSACATTGEKFNQIAQTQSDRASIYFFRPSAFTVSARKLNIFVNSNPEYVLPSGTHTHTYLMPGKYNFGAKLKPYGLGGEVGIAKEYFELEISLEASNTYYIGWFPSLNPFSGEPSKCFIQSQQVNPYVAFESILIDLNGEFGLVKEKCALPKLKESNTSLEEVDPSKI